MVGDRKFDVLGAREAGVASLAVGYGYGTREELAACAPDMFAATVPELFGLLGVARPRGRFFTFEGTDGCGKSTQMALLGNWLDGARLGSRAHARAGRLPHRRAHPQHRALRRR